MRRRHACDSFHTKMEVLLRLHPDARVCVVPTTKQFDRKEIESFSEHLVSKDDVVDEYLVTRSGLRLSVRCVQGQCWVGGTPCRCERVGEVLVYRANQCVALLHGLHVGCATQSVGQIFRGDLYVHGHSVRANQTVVAELYDGPSRVHDLCSGELQADTTFPTRYWILRKSPDRAGSYDLRVALKDFVGNVLCYYRVPLTVVSTGTA